MTFWKRQVKNIGILIQLENTKISLNRRVISNLIFVWPCIIIVDGGEKGQIDETVTVYY